MRIIIIEMIGDDEMDFIYTTLIYNTDFYNYKPKIEIIEIDEINYIDLSFLEELEKKK
jgi:hypothetical protein